MLKTTIVYWNIDKSSKHMNEYNVNIKKKILSKENINYDKTNFFSVNAKTTFTKLK